MHIRSLLLPACLLAIIMAASCKKDDDSQNDKPQKIDDILYPSYSHLDSGNYWVYSVYEHVDSAGNGTPTGGYDSCYVEKDTVIRGAAWYKYVEHFAGGSSDYAFLRDSLDYIVDNYGSILFSAHDFSSVFYHRYFLDPDHHISPVDTFALVERKMAERDKRITVPAGLFTTSSMRLTWTLNDSLDHTIFPSPRFQDTRYSTAVGKVSETLNFYVGDPAYSERRLLRYHVR